MNPESSMADDATQSLQNTRLVDRMNLDPSSSEDAACNSQAAELIALRTALQELQEENKSLELLVDVITEHSTGLENTLKQQNQEMAEYIEQVKAITAAAITVQNHTFTPDSLATVAVRPDELGNLAQVFSETVQAVKHHEQQLIAANEQLSALLKAYSRFVPHEYLTFLKQDSIVNIQLGDHVSKEMAVMFSDIRSFTALSEQMTPKENFDFVNAYLRRVSPEIRNHNGFIVKYLGDGMMAVFPDGVDDAIEAGIAKAKQVHAYNQLRQAQGYKTLQVGIGIHVGHMMVGMVGEANRMQGDAFSDNVNLTARLEGLTKYYGASLLISDEVRLKLNHPEQYSLRLLDRVIVKGRQEPITIYEVLNADTDQVQTLKQQTLSAYQQGQAWYKQGALTQAKACFEESLTLHPTDQTVRFYLARIEQLTQQGIPNNWDGVWTFTHK